jgi:hypothetical protein
LFTGITGITGTGDETPERQHLSERGCVDISLTTPFVNQAVYGLATPSTFSTLRDGQAKWLRVVLANKAAGVRVVLRRHILVGCVLQRQDFGEFVFHVDPVVNGEQGNLRPDGTPESPSVE